MVTRIRVGAASPTAADVIEYARELIATFGWNSGVQADDAETEGGRLESSETAGFTLHDSIGEACTRLSGAVGTPANKDWSITTTEGDLRHMRNESVELLQAELPTGMDDKAFNDQATSVDQIYAVLDSALAKAREGAST